MKLEIDRTGKNDPPWPLVVVDGRACLVDLSGVAGPLDDPEVVKLTWDDQIPLLFPRRQELDRYGRLVWVDAAPAGSIWRGNRMRLPFTDRAALQPYLDAFASRMASMGEA